jgi:hypothetical protein
MVILLAMLLALVATVRTVQQQAERAADGSSGLGSRELAGIAVGAAAVAVLAAAVGQWPLAVAAAIPAGVCSFYAHRQRTG